MEFLKYLAFFILVMIVNGDEDDEVAPGCEDKVMDVYFLLDASSSIWIEHFKELPPFVRNVVSELDIGASKTRVGVSSFSTSMQPAPIRLSRFSDKETLRNYITINNIPYLTGITITSRAIREVRESRDFREDAIKVIVVATDGVSTSRQRSASESDAARKQGFYLFVLGFGIEPNDLEWKDIANDPDQDFIHLVNGIGNDTLYINGSFIQAKDWLVSKICALPPPSTGLGLPEDLCNVDGVYASLYFLSGSGTALNFIYDISRDFVRGTRGNPIDVEVGYRLPTCTNAGLPLRSAEDHCPRVRRFDETSLSNQLNAILTTAQDAVSERGEHNRVAVIVVDDVTRPEISATNIGALRYDLDVILVDLSRSGVGSQVQNALYDPNNYIRFFPGSSNYQQFLRNFGGKVCEAMKRFHSNGGPTPAK